MPLLDTQESAMSRAEQHPIDFNESRVAAKAALMLHHQQMINNARAKARGVEGQVVEPVNLVERVHSVQKPVVSQGTAKSTSGLLNFLINSNQINHTKKQLSDDLPSCDTTMVSTEMTVATADSESEQVLHDIHTAMRQQEDRVKSLKKEIESNKELAQIRYMSRDKVGATTALRVANLKQVELDQEYVVNKRLGELSRGLQRVSFDKDEQSDILQQILKDASVARSTLPSPSNVSEDTLLKEIQKMIRKL